MKFLKKKWLPVLLLGILSTFVLMLVIGIRIVCYRQLPNFPYDEVMNNSIYGISVTYYEFGCLLGISLSFYLIFELFKLLFSVLIDWIQKK